LVRLLLLFFIIINLYGDKLEESVKSLVSEQTYQRHYKLIKKIFQNSQDYYVTPNKIDILKVIKNLKENGLLNLFFDTPKKNIITFKTNSNPLFFMKIVEDNLRNMGYSLFFTKSVDYDEIFEWKIDFVSEYTLDPELFAKFLQQNGCEIIEIKRVSDTEWEYFINIDNAYINAKKLILKEKIRLKRPMSEYWLNVSVGKKISIASFGGNRWYPKITIFDKNLNILKVYKKDEKTDWIVFYLPQNAYYIKISDLYTLSNLKYGLRVTLE